MNRGYLSVLFGLILNLVCVNFAQAENRWWNEEEVSNLCVVRDLKQGRGREYYVDGVNGNDKTGDGMSLRTPWKTIGKAVGRLGPGDTLAITAGVYRERLFIKKSGTKDNPILIGPAGNGEVIIDASAKIDGWRVYRGKIYQAPCLFKPTAVVVDDESLFPEFSLKKVNEGKWYYNAKAKTIYLYIPGGGNPSLHNIGVISDDQYQDAIQIHDANYITLYGLTVRFAGGRGISILGDYNRVEKCNVKFNGHIGITMFGYDNTKTTNTQVVNNHIYHNFMRNWPRGRYKWGGWGGGAVSHGTPNTQYIGNTSHKNGGEGLLAYVGQGGTVFRDNIVYDNWSVNIYVDNQPDCIIERNLVFCHNPNPKDLYNNGDETPNDNKSLRRLRAIGIMTADEDYHREPPANFQNTKIINNIIIGCRNGITHYGQAKGSGLKNVLVANNTIVVPDAKGAGESYTGITIPYNDGNNINAICRNNIVYASHPNTYLLCIDTDPLRINKEFHGLTFDHNIWYHANNPEPFHLGPRVSFRPSSYDIDYKVWAMKAKCAKQGIGSMFIDPKLVVWNLKEHRRSLPTTENRIKVIAEGDFLANVREYSVNAAKLAADSPAINKALPLKEVTTDFFGNARDDSAPDIGAVEFGEEKHAFAQ